MIYIKN